MESGQLRLSIKTGKTLEDMMESDIKNLEKYMEDFVDLQLTGSRVRNHRF